MSDLPDGEQIEQRSKVEHLQMQLQQLEAEVVEAREAGALASAQASDAAASAEERRCQLEALMVTLTAIQVPGSTSTRSPCPASGTSPAHCFSLQHQRIEQCQLLLEDLQMRHPADLDRRGCLRFFPSGNVKI